MVTDMFIFVIVVIGIINVFGAKREDVKNRT